MSFFFACCRSKIGRERFSANNNTYAERRPRVVRLIMTRFAQDGVILDISELLLILGIYCC